MLVLLTLTAACSEQTYAKDDLSKTRVGIVFDIGGKDDRSFNAAAWTGVRCAETGRTPDGKSSCGKPPLNVVVRDVEPGTPVSIEPAIRSFAERGYDPTIGIGFAQAPIIEAVAETTIFISPLLTASASSPTSRPSSSRSMRVVSGRRPGRKDHQDRALGLPGWHGHRADPPLRQRHEEGAKSVNPNIRIIQNYVGVTTRPGTIPGRERAALAQISKRRHHLSCRGQFGTGRLRCRRGTGQGRRTAGHPLRHRRHSNQDMSETRFVLTSMVKHVDNAVYQIVRDVAGHKFQSGLHVFGLDSDGVGYTVDQYNKDLLSPDAINAAEEAKKKIIDGEIKVTDAMFQ
jgi:basic membrane protein A